LYKRIRMERARNPINMSVQICLTNEGKQTWEGREKKLNHSLVEKSIERSKIHKNDIKRLEAKIRQLDKDIKETEQKRKEINRSNSISTHETEFDDENNYYQTPVPERKSMPVHGVQKTLSQIRGIITHMVDLANQDPNISQSISSELSSLIKVRSELRSQNTETPEVIRSIKTIVDKTPSILESFNPYSNMSRSKKRSISKYEQKYGHERANRRKVWKEDLDYYSTLSNNSLVGSYSHKRQKTVEGNNYLSFSEREDSPVKFKFRKNKNSPKVNPFYSPTTLKLLA
jgi:hypothetical protein